MPRITLEWKDGHFCTDCEEIATAFMRCPESMNPYTRGLISEEMRDALQKLLTNIGKVARYGKVSERVDGMQITVEQKRPHMP